jgi:hypothetical protein
MQHQPVLYCFYLCAYVTGKCNEPTPIFAKQRSFLFQAKHATLLPRFIRVSLPVHLALFTSRMKNPVGMMTRHRYQKTKCRNVYQLITKSNSCWISLSSSYITRVSGEKGRQNAGVLFRHHGPVSNQHHFNNNNNIQHATSTSKAHCSTPQCHC